MGGRRAFLWMGEAFDECAVLRKTKSETVEEEKRSFAGVDGPVRWDPKERFDVFVVDVAEASSPQHFNPLQYTAMVMSKLS